MYCIDMGGVTLVIAVVYGWAGARKGSRRLRERTSSSRSSRCSLKPCRKALNSLRETLNDPQRHSRPLVGMVSNLCDGAPGQTTCHSKDTAKESRIDYFFANEWLFPAITKCWVDQCGYSPTHHPLIFEVKFDKTEKVTRESRKTTN